MARSRAHRKIGHRSLSAWARQRRRRLHGEMSLIAPEDTEEFATLETAALEAGEAYLRDWLASLTEQERADDEERHAWHEAQARGGLPPGSPAMDFGSELRAAIERLREEEGVDDGTIYDVDGASWWHRQKVIPAHTAGNGRGRPGRMRRNASYLPYRTTSNSRR